jgi:Tat protein secretion system quality control protein TatD with DNase activity
VTLSIRWTDDHCHLGWDVDEQVDAAEVDAMVAEALDAGVERLVTVGTDALRSAEAVRAAARHPGVVWATVGLHPHEARHGLDGVVDPWERPAWWRWASAGSTTTTTTRPGLRSGRCSPPRSPWHTSATWHS